MHVIKRSTLLDYGKRHVQVQDALMKWYSTVSECEWTGPADLLKDYPRASIIDGHRVVFDIKGNAFRMLVYVQFKKQWMKQGTVFIKRIMTHAEYDELEMKTIRYEG